MQATQKMGTLESNSLLLLFLWTVNEMDVYGHKTSRCNDSR